MSESGQGDTTVNHVKLEASPDVRSTGSKVQSVDDDDVDDFGLPKRPVSRQRALTDSSDDQSITFHDAPDGEVSSIKSPLKSPEKKKQDHVESDRMEESVPAAFSDQSSTAGVNNLAGVSNGTKSVDSAQHAEVEPTKRPITPPAKIETSINAHEVADVENGQPILPAPTIPEQPLSPTVHKANMDSPIMKRAHRSSQPVISEWSHQKLANNKEETHEEEEVQWQSMTAIDEYDVYDDDGKLVAKGAREEREEDNPYAKMGGAGKGYTRVLLDDDAQSQNSFDDDTNYLFKGNRTNQLDDEEVEEDPRDMLQQLQATKNLLTEGQRIAYVGVVRLMIFKMLKALEELERTRATKKETVRALENMEIWGQQMMVRLYGHMEIDTAEQIMIEQLAEHGVQPDDLSPSLMLNARVDNPLADDKLSSQTPISASEDGKKPESGVVEVDNEEVPEVHGLETASKEKQIDLDIRWTVLCDLFLLLVADSVYDARSRRLLERVASSMEITWIQICRFEKRVIDQLEMEEAAKENWDESEHMEDRRKRALTRKYVMMGLATVGGGLVIGLSAGLLAPVIGAGLAAGFTTIGVTGTAGFLGGIGGAALITSTATAAGGTVAIRAAHRRTGHVRTFEYRPLHNNKRLNLILTVSGWMTGKVDDVRLPFSTVDPIMGDIYSLYWEPDMLRSMGDTINILANEALTTSIQQVLGSTLLMALMSAIQLPVILTKLSYLIDNPWSVSLDRATAAGVILADSLIARHLGQRPITLVGFSLGARVIFSCLKELSARGGHGIIQNVYLCGSPVVAKRDEYLRARSVIAGRFVNCYCTNDWILGYLFRATSGGIMRVAGLSQVENVPGLENIDVTELVNGHMAYRQAMPKILRKLKWEVESDEFTEIEDPDPENHELRQRELINEIEEARRKAAEVPEKRRFGLWKRGKPVEKKTWETYDKNAPAHKKNLSIDAKSEEENMWGDGKVLFDIDAIRKELAGEQIDVRELDSTQPPILITTIKNGEKVTEYLRLPPGISVEEAKNMKLPPRPDEVEGSAPTIPVPEKKKSMADTKTPISNKKLAPSPLPEFDEGDFMPKEIKSTLPPLQLTPSLHASPHISANNSPRLGARPELKSHGTMPTPEKSGWEQDRDGSKTGLGLGAGVGVAVGVGTGLAVTGGMEALDIEHNAWEDDGEITMTFA